MTITRLKESGFESRSLKPEFDTVFGTTYSCSPTITRSACFAGLVGTQSGTGYFGWIGKEVTGITAFRVGFHLCMSRVASGSPRLVQWYLGATLIGEMRLPTSHRPTFYVSTASVAISDTALRLGITPANWQHVGLNVSLGASGVIELYLDGIRAASFRGATNTAGGSVNDIRFGTQSAINYFAGSTYFDDVYMDSIVGEASGATAPDRRFWIYSPCGVGASSSWTASPAASNFRNVDDLASGSHDGNATYVSGSITGLRDSYIIEDPLIGNWLGHGDSVIALIPFAISARDDTTASVYNAAGLVSGGASIIGGNICPSSASYQWIRGVYALTDPATGVAWAGSAAVACALMMQEISV